MGRDDVLSRNAIESMIAEGHTVVVYNNNVLKLDSMLDNHKGGNLAIRHMVGRDATDEITVSHPPQICRQMLAYRIGRVDGWVNFTPPIRGGKFRTQSEILCQEKVTGHNGEVFSMVVEDVDMDDDDDDDTASSGSSELDVLSSTVSNVSSASSMYDEAISPWKTTSGGQEGLRQRKGPDDAALPQIMQTRTEYVDSAMQEEIDACLKHYPSLDVETQQDITDQFRALHQRVKDEGLYSCRYIEYAKEAVRYTGLFALFLATLCSGEIGWGRTCLSAAFLGLFWHQIMFTAHDAGHRAITGRFVPDTIIGIFIADFCCGLSIGWWKSSHNVHHLITNHPEHDPDIQNVPLFATCPSFLKSIRSSYYDNFEFFFDRFAEIACQYQKYTYYPVMGIARFNLYLLSWLHLLSTRSANLGAAAWTRPAELAAMTAYWFLFGYVLVFSTIPTWPLRVAFVLVSHIITMPLHVQITLSHWGMPTADLGEAESFAQRQLRTTMDVDCAQWLDWIHGGLQFQAIHHLFPRVPRHNLRTIQPMVRDFCAKTGIEYKILNFVEGNKTVLSRLEDVQKQVVLLLKCQIDMAKTGESGLH